MIDKPDRLDPTRKVGEDKLSGGPTPQTSSFEQAMEKAAQNPGAGQPTGVSPFELAQGQVPLAAGPTFDTLLTQVKSAQGTLGDISTNLQTKNLKLKPSQRYLMRNKLTDANSYLKAANTKLGAEIPPPLPSSGGGIIGKFLDYVSEGQSNLVAAQNQLMNLKGKGEELKPADFLTIQLKLAHAQQEIEYASIMLSKVVEDMKTMFNIQL